MIWHQSIAILQQRNELVKMAISEALAKDAYFDGRDAFEAGQWKFDNPHPSGTPEHRLWLEGWRAGLSRYLERLKQESN